MGALVMVAAAALVVGSVVSALVLRPTSRAAGQVAYLSLDIDPLERLGDEVSGARFASRTTLAISPDGTRLVLAGWQNGEQRLYLRALDRPEADPIPATEGALNPFFSPDGEWVGFWADGQLQKVALAGGLPVPLCETTMLFGASWTADDQIVFGQRSGGLWRVSSQGGVPRLLTQAGLSSHRLPWVMPGGAVLFTELNAARDWNEAQVVVESPVTGERRALIEGAANPMYAASGHLLFVRSGVLWAAPFDAAILEVTGPEVPVLDDVSQAIAISNVYWDTGAAQLSLSPSGSLAHLPGGVVPPEHRRLLWVDRSGNAEPVDLPPSTYWNPRVSPDGQRISVADAIARNVIVFDRSRGVLQRLPGNGINVGVWTPDSERVVFSSPGAASARNLFWQLADGSAPPELITTGSSLQFPGSWSPSGELIYVENHPESHADILSIDPLEPQRGSTPIVAGPSVDAYPVVSPDGRWLAYASGEGFGQYEVFVVAYPQAESKKQVSTGGGYMPTWSPLGDELFYIRPASESGQDDWVMQVSVSHGTALELQQPRELFPFPHQPAGYIRTYDVAPDGRFLMVERGTGPRSQADTSPRIIFNWLSELERLVPTN